MQLIFSWGVPHPSVLRVRVLTLSFSANGIDLNSHVPLPHSAPKCSMAPASRAKSSKI
jgi:hypothetical protein